MKNSLLALLCCLSAGTVHAAPPYIAVETALGLNFAHRACPDIAAQVLRADGFSKVVAYKHGNTLFAAYREGPDYQYKASIKCLPEQRMVLVVVVAENTQSIKTKATHLAGQIRAYSGGAGPVYRVEGGSSAYPDCADGPTLMRCLNTLPPQQRGAVIQYLQQPYGGALPNIPVPIPPR